VGAARAGCCHWNHARQRSAQPHCHKLALAVAVGAPIIIKPHRRTLTSARELAQALWGSGLPIGAIQVVEGCHDQTLQLGSDSRASVISFTGGRQAGEVISQHALRKRQCWNWAGFSSPSSHRMPMCLVRPRRLLAPSPGRLGRTACTPSGFSHSQTCSSDWHTGLPAACNCYVGTTPFGRRPTMGR
jgi:Aldehyde dehydrogenase family